MTDIDQSPRALGDRKAARRQGRAARPVRVDLIERVRAEIAAGSYETDEKMSAAVDQMLLALARSGCAAR